MRLGMEIAISRGLFPIDLMREGAIGQVGNKDI